MASNASSCPASMKTSSNGIFQGDNPLDFALPLAIVQICLVVVLTRTLAFILRPLRQPRVIAEIVGGILLGPSVLGRNTDYLHDIFPTNSITVLDTLANLGLLFYLFLVGLELDPKSIRRTGKKSFSIALAGICFPFALGIGTSFLLRQTISKGVKEAPFLVFMGVALSITAFPVLARILAELKLLTTDLGRLAMSAAAVNDVAAWILLALAVALSGTSNSPLVSLWVFLCGIGFVVICSFIIPPIFRWMAKRCPEGEPVDELYVCLTLCGVLAAGFVTDAIGIHALFGAFIVGVLLPKEGPFAAALVEKVEDLVSGLFLPLYFVSSGLKTDITTIRGAQSWGLLVLVICTACFGKIVATFSVSLACKIPFQEALALGFLMNTKGLVELIVLNIGKDTGVLNDQTFAILVLMAVFATFITTPLVIAVYKPAQLKSKSNYKHRTVQREDPNAQFRILVCFYSIRNIPAMINLIEASRGTDKTDGICIYAMHLVELSERPSAILMVRKAGNNGLPFWDEELDMGNQIVVAFEAFQQLSHVTIRPMTAISAMSNMHEDICASAEATRAAIIILPYHKHQRPDGAWEMTRNDFRWVNKRVLEHARCSVGILVDRGFGGGSHVSACNVSSTIAVLFFGGCDDREALAYGRRMAEHPGINLVVLRFLASPDVIGEITEIKMMSSDENFLQEFKHSIPDETSVKYEEKQINSPSKAIDVIKEVSRRCNLVIVGRMPEGQIAAALDGQGRSDCPELGPLGNLLTSPDISISASVLIVQQHSDLRYSESASSSKGVVLQDPSEMEERESLI